MTKLKNIYPITINLKQDKNKLFYKKNNNFKNIFTQIKEQKSEEKEINYPQKNTHTINHGHVYHFNNEQIETPHSLNNTNYAFEVNKLAEMLCKEIFFEQNTCTLAIKSGIFFGSIFQITKASNNVSIIAQGLKRKAKLLLKSKKYILDNKLKNKGINLAMMLV